MGLEDEDVMEQFSQNDIGDVDNDGASEFLDGWKRPIRFLRWAPGFVPSLGAVTPLQTDDPSTAQPDPFDPRRVFATSGTYPTYAIYPLIYSAGADGIYDILSDFDPALVYRTTNPPSNPYAGTATERIGMPFDLPSDEFGPANGEENWQDNIHNHILYQR
jgi:hypothetical protein